jgi:hypothetical protein
MHWTRPALITKVESLRERHSRDEFVQAVVDFADSLDSEDRKTLQKVLLEHRDHTFRLPLRRRR